MRRFRRFTQQQRAVARALRALGGEMVVTPQTARPLHALRRRGLVRFSRDASGAKVARRRLTAAQVRRRNRGTRNRDLWLGRV
ncbi:MAG: hypothetical protein ACREF4_22000 [Gammaproteobacteria bacterium]